MLDMDGLDGQPVTAEELPLLVVSPSSPLNSNPETVTFALESGESIEIFAVTYIDDKLLVAVPISVWNKRVAQRLLPKDFLQKPVVVEVLACKPEDPSSDLEEFKGRVWMGFIAPSYLAKLEVVTEDVNFDYPFKLGDSEELWPSPRGLVEAAVEHFAFQSAEDLPHAGASGSAVDARLDRLESSVDRMAEMMTQLVSAQQPPVVGRKSVQKSVLQPDPLTADPGTSKFPLLDSSVVHAALAAGVNEDALLEMQKLIGKGQPKVKKLGEPLMTLKPKAKAGKVRNVLSESEDEDGVNAGGSGGVALAHPATGSDSMLGELTKIVKLLTDDKMRKARVSKVEAALEGISSSGVTDGSLGTGKKAAAARRAVRSALQESPEEIYGLLEKLMLEDLSHQTVTPGQPGPVLCARAWLEHRSRVGAYKTSAYAAWSAAGILDSLISGNVAAARARAGLLLLMLDQAAADRGSWVLASELSLEQGPPFAALSHHLPPSVGDGEVPFSRLLDPRWAEVALCHLKDTEEYVNRRGKLGRKGNDESGDPSLKPKPKAKSKGSNPSQGQGE